VFPSGRRSAGHSRRVYFVVRVRRSAAIHWGSDVSASWLNSIGNVAFGVFYGPEICSVDCTKGSRSDPLSRRQQIWKLGGPHFRKPTSISQTSKPSSAI